MNETPSSEYPPYYLESNWKSRWSFPDGVVYLNHGSFGPSPDVVRHSHENWSQQLEQQPCDFLLRRLPVPVVARVLSVAISRQKTAHPVGVLAQLLLLLAPPILIQLLAPTPIRIILLVLRAAVALYTGRQHFHDLGISRNMIQKVGNEDLGG